MKQHGLMRLLALGIVVTVSAASCAPRAERGVTAASADPLEAGWRFACAITNDFKDRAVCQEKVALAYLARGDCATALKRGAQIENWRKGVVLAEAAATLAEGGQTNAALECAAQAEAIARGIQDWQRDLIQTRVVKTKALLGQEREASRWSAFYQSNLDYRGEVAAYQALALARGGQVTNALAVLDSLGDTTHLDVSSWRADGYRLLARDGRLDPAQTTNALALAWAASSRIPGSKRWEKRLELVETAAACGASAFAQDWMAVVSSNVMASNLSGHIRAPVLAQVAIRWGALRNSERLTECVQTTEPLIRPLQGIEQPALFALLGEAWVRLGDIQKGLTSYERAMELAGGLADSRLRAIACVDICLSLERARLRHRQTTEGLNRLLAGFGAAHG